MEAVYASCMGHTANGREIFFYTIRIDEMGGGKRMIGGLEGMLLLGRKETMFELFI